MTLVNLDSIQFYQLPIKADLADKQSSMASVNDVLVVCKERYAPTVSRSIARWSPRHFTDAEPETTTDAINI